MNRILLFLFACIPARLLLAWSSTKIPPKYLPLFGALLLAMSLGFLYLYFTGRKLQVPASGGVAWWAQFRLIIGLLYLAAAIYALQGHRDLIWVPLVMDVIFGSVIFYLRYFTSS